MTISRLQKCVIVALLVTLICQKKLCKSLRGPLLCSLQHSDASDVGLIIKRHERHGRVAQTASVEMSFSLSHLLGFVSGALVIGVGPA